MRMSIFDINESNWKMSNETDKIIQMFEESPVAVLIKEDGEYDYSKAMHYDFFIDTVCLSSWKAKGTATTFAEFLSRIHYTSIKEKAHHDAHSFIHLIELVYNCYMLVENNNKPFESILVFNNPILKDILDYDLKKVNCYAVYNKETETVIIKETGEIPSAINNKAVAAPKNIEEEVAEYRGSSLQGNIKRKREILLDMGNEFEPKANDLKIKYRALEDNISFLLNNMNVRHNNKEPGGFYHKKSANLTDFEQELIYDNLYYLMCLAFEIFENEGRMKYTETLKKMCMKKRDSEDA